MAYIKELKCGCRLDSQSEIVLSINQECPTHSKELEVSELQKKQLDFVAKASPDSKFSYWCNECKVHKAGVSSEVVKSALSRHKGHYTWIKKWWY